MAPLVGPQPQADHQGHGKTAGQMEQVSDAHHDIVFLIGICPLPDQIKIPEILLGRLQLHHGNGSLWGGSGKILVRILSSGCHGRQKGAVAVFVRRRDQGQGIRGRQRLVDLFFGILGPIKGLEAVYRIRGAGFQSLVPDPQDPGASVRLPEQGILIVDACVHEADEDALALVSEGGDPGGGKDPGGLHAVGVQEGIELRDGRIGIVGKIHGAFQIVHGNVEHGELAADKIDAFDAGHGR